MTEAGFLAAVSGCREIIVGSSVQYRHWNV